MPISPRNARSAVRVALPLLIASFAIAVMSGCPTPPVTPPATGGDGPGVQATSSPRPSSSPRPTSGVTLTPEPVLTPRTTITSAPQATIVPSSFFATPTPEPSVKTPPPFENVGIELFQGATTSSPFALNQFRIRYDDNSADTPDLPTRRTYQAYQMKGFIEGRDGFQSGKYATESTVVNWSISGGNVEHTNVDSSMLPGLMAFFRVDGVATDTVKNASTVSVETATISSGVLLTFTATVSLSTDSTAVGTPAAASAGILASSTGKADFEISTLGVRFARPVRLVP